MKRGFLQSSSNRKHGVLRDPRSEPNPFAASSNSGWGSSSWGSESASGGGGGNGSKSGWGTPVVASDTQSEWARSNAAAWTCGEDGAMAVDSNGGNDDPPRSSSPVVGIDNRKRNPLEGTPFIPKDAKGNPKGTLLRRYPIELTRDINRMCFTFWDDGNVRTDKKKYTCVFACPLTGELFPSGQWGDSEIYDVREEESMDGSAVQVVWYTKKKYAEHAAAARALDCLTLREEISSYKLCKEKPYLADDAPPLSPSMPPIEDVDVQPSTIVPKDGLVRWYRERYMGDWFPKDHFLCWSNDDTGPYTCVFTCPVTGERFASGRHGDTELYEVKEEQGEDESSVVQVVWYRNKKMAENGAAARALDCFSLRENKSNPDGAFRICVEEPIVDPADETLPPSFPQLPPPSLAGLVPKAERAVPMDVEQTEEEDRLRSDYRVSRAMPVVEP